MKWVQRIGISLSAIILAVCCAALLVFGVGKIGWKAMAIPTGSMRPDIPPGSLVLVHSVPISSLKIGDVITRIDKLDPKVTISHRLVREYKNDAGILEFVTKGDANKAADQPVIGKDIIGKVVRHVPHVGWVLLDAKKPWVILPIVYIAGLLITIEELIRLRDYFKLGIPYRVPGFAGHSKKTSVASRRVSQGAMLTAVFVVVSAAVGPSALAAIRSNTVSVADNRITVASVTPPPTTCKGNNKNTTTINTTTTQTGSSGNVFVSGNKGNTGNVSSGSVSNNNTTTITVNQGC